MKIGPPVAITVPLALATVTSKPFAVSVNTACQFESPGVAPLESVILRECFAATTGVLPHPP